MQPLKNIAICGTQTPLGKRLRDALIAQGVKVLAIRESDLKIPAPSLAEKLAGVDGIVTLHGEPYVAKWRGRYEFDIYCSRLLAIRSIGNAIRFMETKPNFFLTISNAMIYDTYEVHDEYSNEYGDSFMAEVGQMETTEALKIKRHSENVRLLIARTGYIMSRTAGAYPLWAAVSRIGWGGRINEGYQCIPMILEADAVRAIIFLAQNQATEGIYNLTIPEMASMNEMVNAFAKALDKNQHRLPNFIIRLMAGRAYHLLEQNCKVLPRRLTMAGFSFDAPNVDSIITTLQKER